MSAGLRGRLARIAVVAHGRSVDLAEEALDVVLVVDRRLEVVRTWAVWVRRGSVDDEQDVHLAVFTEADVRARKAVSGRGRLDGYIYRRMCPKPE